MKSKWASSTIKVVLLFSVFSLMIPGYAIPSAFAPSCTPPPSNMISWWPGDGDALDIQDGNDGTLKNGATFATGLVGAAFSLDGINDFVEVANESNFDFADSKFAVDGWFKTSESNKRQMIVTKGGFTSGFSWQVEIATSNKLVAGLFQGTNGLNVIVRQSTNTLNDGAWHHFAVNFDNKAPESATLYIDGVLDNNLLQEVPARTVTISNEPVLIGARNIAAPQLFFNGLIDEVEIFDGFLTAQEIFDIWFAGSEGKCKEPSEIEVEIDVKPASCPNPVNVKSKGVLPVAILGSAELDVTDIDVSTIELNGVSPIRSEIEDVATPFGGILEDELSCTTDGADGFDDLTLKFKTQDIIAAIGPVDDGDVVTLTLTGALNDATALSGQDNIIIKKKGK